MINIDANRAKDGTIYADKYYWYPKGNSNTHKENKNTAAGAFYACDRVNFSNDSQQQNGISDRGFEHLTIETNKRYNFKVGDRVRSVTDERFWEIEEIPSVDDDSKAKELSLNVPTVRILKLVRTEEDTGD